MARLLFTCFSIGLLAMLLASCCANNTCDCEDQRADAIYLRYEVGGSRGFSANELDTIVLRRYKRDSIGHPKASFDSFTFIRSAAQAGQAIVLDNTSPLPLMSGRKVNSFEYLLLLRHPVRADTLHSLDFAGALESDGCCTCYRNTRKNVRVNSTTYNLTETNREPRYITLRK